MSKFSKLYNSQITLRIACEYGLVLGVCTAHGTIVKEYKAHNLGFHNKDT